MLAEKLEDVVADEVVAVSVGDTQNINDAHGVMLNVEGVVFHDQVLCNVSFHSKTSSRLANLRVCSVEDFHLRPEVHFLDLLQQALFHAISPHLYPLRA